MEPIVLETNPAASAPTQGPPQPVSISSTLTNASPNGRTSGGDNRQKGNENETSSPTRDTVRTPRKNRLSVENLTCTSCGKVCSNKSKYMRHLSTHSEERPYSCPLCKKGFKWVEYLSKHMKQQHPNTSLDITAVTSNVPQTAEGTTTSSEGSSVNISMETDENLDSAPPLLQGRLTIPAPVSLLPSLDTGQTRVITKEQSNGVVEKDVPLSSASNSLPVTKETAATIVGELVNSQEYSGKFKDVHQSAVVIVCTTDTVINTTGSLPVTTLANGSSPVTMTTSEKSTVTSSFESSCHNTVTFAVPILHEDVMSSTTKTVTSLISHLYPKTTGDNVLDHSGLSGASFDGSFSTNSSFDQSVSVSSENALIVPGGAFNCQLVSSLASNGIQSLGENLTEGNGDLNAVATTSPIVKKYICEHEGCAKTYRYKKDVIRHMKMKHGSQPTRYEQKEVPEMLLRKHSCSQCDKMYAHRKDLLRHQRDVHSPEARARREASKSNQKKYPCEQPNCNKLYVHKKDLIRHRRNDHNDLTDTKDMKIPEPVSPSQYSPSPAKRQRTNNWASSKVISTKAETAAEPMAASEVQWLGVTVVKEGNVSAVVMATSDTNTDTLASNCALFNTSPSSSNAATSLLSLLNSTSQQSLPVDTAAAQLIGQTASVHPLFSAVTNNTQETTTPVVTSQ